MAWADLPADVQSRTKELFLDFLGVALAGTRDASTASVRTSRQPGTDGPATVIGLVGGAPAEWAALVNGTSAHAMELDDVTRASSLHPGVVVIPAALAIAEEIQASPADLLRAIVGGYETTIRAGNALNPASAYRRGFHPTGVAGVFGAAMASGLLLNLNLHQLTNALGIAGTLASGSLEYLESGAWTKRLNAGWAAHSGVWAARLASSNFTGPESVFEGRLGFLRGYSDAPRPAMLLQGLGQDEPLVMSVSIKPYACCRYNHGLIDGMLRIRDQVDVEAVDHIRLGVLTAGALLVAEPIDRKRAPLNTVDAQFSAPFAAAVALVHGSAGVEQFTPAVINETRIQRLMSVTDCYTDSALDGRYPEHWPSRVEVHLRDGTVLREEVEFALGDPENPVGEAALISKFTGLAEPLSGLGLDAEFAYRVLDLEREANLGFLGDRLRSVQV